MKVSQARRLKELEQENVRLKRAVADLTLDKLVLREALEGNYSAPSVVEDALSTCAMSWEYERGVHVCSWPSRDRLRG